MSVKLNTLRELEFNNMILVDCHKISEYGEPLLIWRHLYNKYSERTPLREFQIESAFKVACEDLFHVNEWKYQKLLKTMEMYDPTSPYHIKEEHTLGAKQGKMTTTPNGTTTTTNKQTSMDNPNTLNITDSSETSYDNANTKVEYEHNISETFEDKTLSNLASSSKKYDSRTGNIGNHAFSDLMDKERESIMNFNLIDIICKDIIDKTCLKIFSLVDYTDDEEDF